MTYEQLQKANESIKTTPIKGKDYAEVNQRIKAFRMVYPDGFIEPRLISDSDGVCTFKAEVGFYKDTDNGARPIVLGVGHAQEKEDSSFINKTSYIENCETSAVGRALGMAGFGIDTSVASADEVQTAIENQNKDEELTPVLIPTEEDAQSVATEEQVAQIEKLCKSYKVPAQFIAGKYKKDSLEELTRIQAYSVVNSWDKVKASYEKTLEGIPFN